MSEPHDVVKLLLARMESHPEEFTANGSGRWAHFLDELIPFVTEEERVMLRKPMMQTIHEEVLEELCNGPEKRRKHKEDTEYERHLAQLQQAAYAQSPSLLQGLAGSSPNRFGGGGGILPVTTSPYQNAAGQGVVGKLLHQTWLDDYLYTGSITAAQPEPKLKPYDKIKKALGIKK